MFVKALSRSISSLRAQMRKPVQAHLGGLSDTFELLVCATFCAGVRPRARRNESGLWRHVCRFHHVSIGIGTDLGGSSSASETRGKAPHDSSLCDLKFGKAGHPGNYDGCWFPPFRRPPFFSSRRNARYAAVIRSGLTSPGRMSGGSRWAQKYRMSRSSCST